ncbi:MAG TPA: toll/interleukin-1 receptor domain-containing protein [Thermoanaerobaculia bacterium]
MTTYVPGFECDVFISYSHANDAEGWVARLSQKLDNRLKERIPPGAVIFRDTKDLQGNKELTPEIVRRIRKSAVLIVIVSRSYVTRPWCIKECEEFIAANTQKGLGGRIFPVRYDDVSPADYQKLVGERLGYEFFDTSEGEKNGAFLETDSETFKARLNVLRRDVGDELEDLKRGASVPGGEVTPDLGIGVSRHDRPAVFLAEPSPGVAIHRDQTASYLQAFGCTVVQPGDRFYEGENYQVRFAGELRRCLLFVQVLGCRPFPHPDYAIQSWDRWQFLQAREAGVPTLLWFYKYDNDGNVIDLQRLDADHREFIAQTGAWDCDAQPFRELVRAEVARRFHDLRQHERATGANGAHPLVVLRADRLDKVFAEAIGRTLKQFDCDWLRVPDRDVDSLQDFAAEYAANGLLVVYRECPDTWVLRRLQEMRKFLQTEFGRRWACGLWHAPLAEDALSFEVEGLYVIRASDGDRLADGEHFNEFVTQLRTRTAATIESV